jgi:pimeloyl-ACP methyl ester carboxylesterase
MLEEAFRPGAAGVAADIVADQVVPWGFDPAAIGAPTTLLYGVDDGLVPVEHGRWWASAIPDAVLHEVPDAGHLLLLTSWARVLDGR